MKINYKFALILSFIALVFSGCVKDKGNYDYNDILEIDFAKPAIKVEGVVTEINNDGYVVLAQNDELNISFSSDMPKNSSYSWKVQDENPISDADGNYEPIREIATTKDLKVPFASAPGKYVLYYYVSDNGGAQYTTSLKVSVESVSGLLVLHTGADGKGDFSAVQTSEILPSLQASKLKLIHNCYSSSNDGSKIEDPSRIWIRARTRSGVIKYVFLGTSNNLLSVDFNTLSLFSDKYTSLFLIRPDAFKPMAFVDGVNNKELLISAGQIYGIDYAMSEKKYGSHLGRPGKKYSNCLEVFAAPTNRHVVFNVTDKSFEMIDNFNKHAFFINGGGEVNVADTKMDLLSAHKGNGATLNAIMKDGATINYVKFNLTDLKSVICESKTDITSLPGVNDQNRWTVSQTGNFAYYSSGNTLYLYDHANKRSTPTNVNLPSGAEIAYLKIHVDATNIIHNNTILFIGVNNGAQGTVYQYKINTLNGNIDATSMKEFTGFGKILDAAFKN